jgi:hypothetical protein
MKQQMQADFPQLTNADFAKLFSNGLFTHILRIKNKTKQND